MFRLLMALAYCPVDRRALSDRLSLLSSLAVGKSTASWQQSASEYHRGRVYEISKLAG